MAFYEWKKVRNRLIEAGWLDSTASPINKDKYGEFLCTQYDGNFHTITDDYIDELEQENKELKASLPEIKRQAILDAQKICQVDSNINGQSETVCFSDDLIDNANSLVTDKEE